MAIVSAQLEPPTKKAERPLMPPPRIPPKVTHKIELEYEIGEVDDNEVETLKLKFHLYGEQCPTAVENFIHLCKGDLGNGPVSGKPLSYKNTEVHRIVPHFLVQAGDITHGNGVGGEAAISKLYFDDDPQCLKQSLFNYKYFIAVANRLKPNTNGSQFFVTAVKTRWLDHHNMLFGRLSVEDDFDDAPPDDDETDYVENFEQLMELGSSSGKPIKPVRIRQCTVLPLSKQAAVSRQD